MNAEEFRVERVRGGVFSPVHIRITHIASGLAVNGFAPIGQGSRYRLERMLLVELECMVSAKATEAETKTNPKREAVGRRQGG
jgi:hypothetical protein